MGDHPDRLAFDAVEEPIGGEDDLSKRKIREFR
jgi:hypothetical protein